MGGRITEKIKLWGIVQGVGFRPFVAKCADKYGMKGEVLNIGGLVDIIVTDTEERIDAFVEAIKREKPVPAEIVHIKREVLGREKACGTKNEEVGCGAESNAQGAGFREFNAFTILRSDDGDDEAAMIPADLSICPDCLAELEDEHNPRYRHPFISCMVCGPRYTVIDRIPYDRENTAMIDWPMCSFCEGEYTDRNDRRYHAQTISCHDCGPYLRLRMNENTETFVCAEADDSKCDCMRSQADEHFMGVDAIEQTEGKSRRIGSHAFADESILHKVCELLQSGKVVAMKGVGGYNLLADPLSKEAVCALREIKAREQKPFAVMFKDADEVKKFCYMNEAEENLLKSSAKPIILLEHRNVEEMRKAASEMRRAAEKMRSEMQRTADYEKVDVHLANSSAGFAEIDFTDIEKSRFIGSFLPSMGAQYMLLKMYAGPLIVTSANLSDMPIIKDEEEMFAMMNEKPLIAACLYNERDIRVRVDDSVVRVIDGQPQMIRRSKGYAPVPLFISAARETEEAVGKAEKNADARGTVSADGIDKSVMVLATGGQLKNSFALSKGQFSYVSQYFGDLDSAENRALYEENVERMKALFRIEPNAVACDLHPLYYTTQFAWRYASEHAQNKGIEGGKESLPVICVQHHHAHVASVMAEHHIEDTVIGVSMDGTGFGTDGNIWGGEFLVCRGGEFTRAAHIKYVNMIGGDGSMKEAWKSALCYLIDYENERSVFFADKTEKIEKAQNKAKVLNANTHQIKIDLSDIYEYAEKNKTVSERAELPLITAALKSGINGILSSSMGRMFDAVAALLGVKDYNDYEGQCAIMLEDAAARAQKTPGVSERDDLALSFHIRIAEMIAENCRAIRAGEYDFAEDETNCTNDIAGAASARGVCKNAAVISGKDVNKVVLTGGVFQNRILTELTLELLRKDGFETYYNVSVSPNDGGIALGQNYVALHKLALH